jgi:hypothetical protein
VSRDWHGDSQVREGVAPWSSYGRGHLMVALVVLVFVVAYQVQRIRILNCNMRTDGWDEYGWDE